MHAEVEQLLGSEAEADAEPSTAPMPDAGEAHEESELAQAA
jgi:hypothetical protein